MIYNCRRKPFKAFAYLPLFKNKLIDDVREHAFYMIPRFRLANKITNNLTLSLTAIIYHKTEVEGTTNYHPDFIKLSNN